MKISINNSIAYPIDEGWTLTENYNETLDSATVRISHLENEIDIEPFDDAKIMFDNGSAYRNMCVDSINCVQEAIGQDDTTYSYTITLFSLTKKLEGIVLPNLSITPHKDNTNIIYIRNYLTGILNFYGPKRWNNSDEEYENVWSLSDELKSKFETVVAPEMQWSKPTFREIFTDLMMTQDCIPILRKKSNGDEEIHYIDLTVTNDASSKEYNYVQKTYSSDDYVSEIKMELQNVMQTKVEGINNTVTTCEYLTFTSDDAIITSENLYLKTQFPILKINHLWLYCFGADSNGDYTKVVKFDLCNFNVDWVGFPDPSNKSYSLVYEKKEYDMKNVVYRSDIPTLTSVRTSLGENAAFYSSYKNFCLYFVRNTNRIEGFSTTSKPFLSKELQLLSYLKVFNACINRDQLFGGLNNAIDIVSGSNSYFTTYFQIEYETTYDVVFSASKKDRPRNNRMIADNQTNAWVDAYSQGFLEYQKANRLGNLQKMYNQRIDTFSDLYVIGDKINDDIVYRTEYQIYTEHIECNAYATKNYVLRDYFTGIKSKIRTWVNAREEAFIRHDLKKYYCEFSYEYKTMSSQVDPINENKMLIEYLLSPMNSNYATASPIKYVLIRTQNPGYNYYPSDDKKYALNCITRLIGNSIVLTAGFDDNWIVEKHVNTGTRSSGSYNTTGIITDTDIAAIDIGDNSYTPPHFAPGYETIGGITTTYYRYCDNYGEFQDMYMYFLNELQVSDSNINQDNDAVKPLFIDFYNLPAVKDSINNDYKFGVALEGLHKDNKEKPAVSIQFEFMTDDDSINFTKNFLQKQSMIRNVDTNGNIFLRLYDANHNHIDVASISELDIVRINEYCVEIVYAGSTVVHGNTVKYVAICDSDGQLISFDITKNNNNSVFLNIRRYL